MRKVSFMLAFVVYWMDNIVLILVSILKELCFAQVVYIKTFFRLPGVGNFK
jgi:hypothetical protein